MNNMKNTWKSIENLISWKQPALPNIHFFSHDNEATNPKKNNSISYDYFSTIAEKTENSNFQINHLIDFSSMPMKTLS